MLGYACCANLIRFIRCTRSIAMYEITKQNPTHAILGKSDLDRTANFFDNDSYILKTAQ